jgi:hypothetical protein
MQHQRSRLRLARVRLADVGVLHVRGMCALRGNTGESDQNVSSLSANHATAA